jgi:hypothetical protein
MERCQPIDQLPTYRHSKEIILFTTARATRVPVGSDQINGREWSSSGAQHGRRSEPHIPVKTGDRERHPIRPCMIVSGAIVDGPNSMAVPNIVVSVA